jgi:hypothetical protein
MFKRKKKREKRFVCIRCTRHHVPWQRRGCPDESDGGGRVTFGPPALAASRSRFTLSNCTVKPCTADAALCSSHTPNLGTADALCRLFWPRIQYGWLVSRVWTLDMRVRALTRATWKWSQPSMKQRLTGALFCREAEPRPRGDYAASVRAAGNGVRRRRARPAKGDDGVPRRGRDGGSPAAGTTAAVRTCSARRPCRPARCCCSRPAGGCGSAHSAARRPSRRRRRDRPQRAVLRVVGVVRLVLQLRRSGTLVLAHLVEVDGVPGIVAAPGTELGHGRAFLHVQGRTIQ